MKWVGWLFLVILFAAAFEAAGETRAGPPKRIVLVTIDTWRADAIGASGSRKVKTSNLDAMASGGLYCPRAWASSTMTTPSHATVLTGLQPYHHGIRDNHGFRLKAGVITLAESFRAAGYATAAFISAMPLSKVTGLDRGFTHFDDRLPPGSALSIVPAWRRGADTVEAAVDWMKKTPGRSFVWVHLYEPHAPYEPPEPYRKTYAASPYYGEVAYTDELVGRLKKALGGGAEDLWLVCGDHGESLGEHGEATHGIFVYDATARVPLILWAPGRIAPGRIESGRLVDIVPTLLSACGLPIPKGLDGRVLTPKHGDSAVPPPDAYVETLYPFLNFGAAPVVALADGRFKVILVPKKEVYDLAKDAAEANNLFGSNSAGQSGPLFGRLVSTAESREKPERGSTSREDLESLASLGYIGAGGEYRLGEVGMDPKDFAPIYARLERPRALAGASRWAETVPLYLDLLKAFPRSPLILAELGLAELALGKASEAEGRLRQSLALNPRNAEALLGLANLLAAKGDASGAESLLLKVTQEAPDDLDANFNLGALYYEHLGQPVKAIPFWERFLNLAPGDREAPRIRELLAKAKGGQPPR